METSDLVRRLCYALRVAERSLKVIGREGFINPDIPDAAIRREKIIAETGLLLYVASLAGDLQEIKQRIDGVAKLLIPEARNDRILLEICLQPALAIDYAQAHIFLTMIGYPDTGFDRLLAETIDAQTHHGRERFPHRVLEQEWLCQLWKNTTQNIDSISRTIASTSLNNPLDLLYGTRDDMYAFTHAMMYVSGFNHHPWNLPRNRAEILLEAEGMLARCLDQQDYDLAAELLLSWPLTGDSWSTASAFSFHVLRRIEDKVGFLPSPSTRIDTLGSLHGIEREKYFLATAYHTIYVMGLLCAVCLQRDKPIAEVLPDTYPNPGGANRILPYIEQDGQNAHWLEDFSLLSTVEKDALTGFLLDIAFYRNIRNKKYEVVFDLLKLGFELNIATTPMAGQSAALLERLALFSSLSLTRTGSSFPHLSPPG